MAYNDPVTTYELEAVQRSLESLERRVDLRIDSVEYKIQMARDQLLTTFVMAIPAAFALVLWFIVLVTAAHRR